MRNFSFSERLFAVIYFQPESAVAVFKLLLNSVRQLIY
nr:MAG TPA: hypothetical protein [Caudoviricetes sp.]